MLHAGDCSQLAEHIYSENDPIETLRSLSATEPFLQSKVDSVSSLKKKIKLLQIPKIPCVYWHSVACPGKVLLSIPSTIGVSFVRGSPRAPCTSILHHPTAYIPTRATTPNPCRQGNPHEQPSGTAVVDLDGATIDRPFPTTLELASL